MNYDEAVRIAEKIFPTFGNANDSTTSFLAVHGAGRDGDVVETLLLAKSEDIRARRQKLVDVVATLLVRASQPG